jgi:ferritin-like metal-binding protein YciE
MKIMRDLFEKQLQNLYNSELLILNALLEMLEHATDGKLADIINAYIKETGDQKERLVEISDFLHI